MVALDCGGDDVELTDDLLSNLDFISPNETDPQRDGVSRIRTELLSKYPKMNVILKLGSTGSMFVNQKHKIFMPTVTKFSKKILQDYEIVDTTAAGDCFTASFFVKLLEQMDGREFKYLD